MAVFSVLKTFEPSGEVVSTRGFHCSHDFVV